MVAGDLLRMAWEAEHDGRTRLRDSLLTMAVIESDPAEPWVERGRLQLVRDRPDHFLAHFETVEQALGDPRVIDARDRLRVKYPPARVQSLLLRASASRGPYLGRVESLGAMIEDLLGAPSAELEENVRLDRPQPSRGPLFRQRAPRALATSLAGPSLRRSGFPGTDLDSSDPMDPPIEANPASEAEEFAVEYATVLLAIAFLLASVRQGGSDPVH